MNSCSRRVELRRARPLLGTIVEITAVGESSFVVAQAIQQAFARVENAHAIFSYHDPESELSRMNRASHRSAFRVSESMWEVLSLCRSVFQASAGAFDPSVAPVLAGNGFLPAHEGCGNVGEGNFSDVEFLDGRKIRFRKLLHLDFGGIAKGWAIDQAIDALFRAGISEGLVNAGGDLRAFGARDWAVVLRDPARPGRLLHAINLRDGAIATTAIYASRRRQAGRWASALVDPRSGRCWLGRSSISVCAADAVTADALTKVVALCGEEKARQILEKFAAKAFVLSPNCSRLAVNRLAGADASLNSVLSNA